MNIDNIFLFVDSFFLTSNVETTNPSSYHVLNDSCPSRQKPVESTKHYPFKVLDWRNSDLHSVSKFLYFGIHNELVFSILLTKTIVKIYISNVKGQPKEFENQNNISFTSTFRWLSYLPTSSGFINYCWQTVLNTRMCVLLYSY